LPQGNNLNAVQFVDANTAFAVSEGGTILKPNDKGVTWSRMNYYDNKYFNGLYFVNTDVGYVGGG
jgi:photosystem II stability/assembly factor-like uncharacterized protein